LIVFIYATSVQNVDPEEYGGIIEIIKEGFMTAFATFLVRKCISRYFSNPYVFLGFVGRTLFGILRSTVTYTYDIVIECLFFSS
jgi:hypothetical protein